MRRDVWRVGIGRLLLEGALGVLVVQCVGDGARILAIASALLGVLLARAAIGKRLRRAFWAAHLALGAAALAAHVPVVAAASVLAVGLGAAIELAHVELLDRRRMRESQSSLRVPSSFWVRRLGSAVIAAAIGEAAIPVAALGAHPEGLAPVFVVLGVIALLAAGIGAGPGRPVTRPVDALVFVFFATLLAIPGRLSGWSTS